MYPNNTGGNWNQTPFMQGGNQLRQAIMPYANMLASVITRDIQQTAEKNILRKILYMQASQSQFTNQLFMDILNKAALLAEMFMSSMQPEQAITQAAVFTNEYYAANMVNNPASNGHVSQQLYNEAVNMINNGNMQFQNAMNYIQSRPQMQNTMVDPRFGNPMQQGMMPNMQMMPSMQGNQGMSQFANTQMMPSAQGGFQMPMQHSQMPNNIMAVAGQTEVKTTVGVLQAKKQAASQAEVLNKPVFVDVPKTPISAVMSEINTTKPNPLQDLVATTPVKQGSRVVMGSVEQAPLPVIGEGIVRYCDPDYNPTDILINTPVGRKPSVFNPYEGMGHFDYKTSMFGVSPMEVKDVDYVKHRNFHLLTPKTGMSKNNDNLINAIQMAAVVSDVKSIVDSIEKERNEVGISPERELVLEYGISESVQLGLVVSSKDDYHTSAYACAKNENLTLDIDNSAIRMTAVHTSDWCLGSQHEAFIKKLAKVKRWSDVVELMRNIQHHTPIYMWNDIDDYMLSVYNEISMIELDSGVYITGSFTESVMDGNKDIAENMAGTSIDFITKSLQLFKERIVFTNTSEFDDEIPADFSNMYLTTFEDVTLLPITSDDVLLVCPTAVGSVCKSVTPVLYGYIDLVYNSARKGVRHIKLVTLDNATIYVYKSAITGDYLITANVNFQ